MRIADKMTIGQVDRNLQKNRSDMTQLQTQAATQKRVNRPSDDPLAASRVLASRADEQSYKQFIQNISQAKSFLEFSEQALGELNESLVRAKELAIAQATDGGTGEETRRITAEEVHQIYQQAVQIGNRKLGERYIFGGYSTLSQPFNSQGQYSGDDGDMKIQIHKDAFIGMNIAGSKVFLGKGLNSNGTTRAADVAEIPKTVEDLKRQRLEREEMEKHREDNEKNTVMTRGLASVQYDQKIGHEDPVTGEEGLNVFETLRGLEISLKTNDKQGIQESLDLLDQAISQVVLARAELGSRVGSLNATTDSLQRAIVDNKGMASNMEDADMFDLVSNINKTESALKATMDTSSKMVQRSLLDFLR